MEEKLTKSNEHISKLKRDKSALKVENQEDSELLKALTEDYQKFKHQKKKTSQKLAVATEKHTNLEASNAQLLFEVKKLKKREYVTCVRYRIPSPKTRNWEDFQRGDREDSEFNRIRTPK